LKVGILYGFQICRLNAGQIFSTFLDNPGKMLGGHLQQLSKTSSDILQLLTITTSVLAVSGCQNDTLNSESQNMVLPCIEAKRFEESSFSCTWLLQQTAAML